MADRAARSTPRVPATRWMQPLPPAFRLILQGDAEVRRLAGRAFEVELSEEPCRARVGSGRATLWLGPDEHLLIGADADADTEVIAQLEAALAELPHSLVDVSHRQFAFEVRGPRAELILNAACPLDLDIGEFPVNMCTRTLLAKADILLWRSEPDVFQVEVWRSFRDYVVDLLSEIAGEFHRE
jgi:sarcosine oxidase, subunit gamma